MGNRTSGIWSFLGAIFIFAIVFGIPGYFLWNIIVDIFGGIPSSRIEFRGLLERNHGMIFYIFSGIVILWWVLFNVVYRFLIALQLFFEDSSWQGRGIAIWLWLLFITTGALPYLSYLFISESLYWYYFDFHQMLTFIGTFEFMLIFVAIFEAFIGTTFISPITRMILYVYLLIQFV